NCSRVMSLGYIFLCIVLFVFGLNKALQRSIYQRKDIEQLLNNKVIILPSRSWAEWGMIYCDVISDGTTGEEWIRRLEKKGIGVSWLAKEILVSPSFIPSKKTLSDLRIIRGSLFHDKGRSDDIYNLANLFKLKKPYPEVACLICEKLLDKKMEGMGLKGIKIMHQWIDYQQIRYILAAFYNSAEGGYVLEAISQEKTDYYYYLHGYTYAADMTNLAK
ncbi:MAG: hypothetical protein PHF35_03105, partial [Candidatus Moranbacteria bacterium]|nr:hypothetical protein [Candidatus Moranbacteria bacterium]